MSLVEQAIAKLRQSQGADRIEIAPFRPVAAIRPIPADDPENAANHLLALNVDTDALRASGYLPEEGSERQFAKYYHEVKRPLIEKALSGKMAGDTPSGRVVMVTSAFPGEGKTFTSINLALSMARERDISVLLVDADILKPRISEIFGIRQERGLMDALADEGVRIESLVMSTNVRGLSILPSGRAGEGAAEMLSSNRMRQLLTELISHDPRRVVVLDSPPLLATSEAKLLTKIAGQIVLVVRAWQTPRGAVQEAIGHLGGKPSGGIVINEGSLSLTESYYGYGAYGSESDEKTDHR